MPKLPMDYSKCCIYKIEHVDDESLVYVGHTTSFDKRKTKHKSSCYNENGKQHNYKLYQMIRDNGGWEMFNMIEVEKYPCNDKREAERRENEVMKELKANMNAKRSYRTEEDISEYHKEYYEANKPKIQEKEKEYRENNKEKIQEQKKEYRENNKSKIQEQKKNYYESNTHKIQEQKKEHYEANKHKTQIYYEANKSKINAKIKCECGCEVVKRYLKEHQATKKHLDKMK
jgi:hypothetical protein